MNEPDNQHVRWEGGGGGGGEACWHKELIDVIARLVCLSLHVSNILLWGRGGDLLWGIGMGIITVLAELTLHPLNEHHIFSLFCDVFVH